MGQLNFLANINHAHAINRTIANGTLYIAPFNILDSISFATFNFIFRQSSAANYTHTLSLGLYSLNGSTLSLANSATTSFSSDAVARQWVSVTATSATQNITPGTWWFGFLISTGGNAAAAFGCANTFANNNNFPGSFIGGLLSVSTNALPASIATTDVSTGSNTFIEPSILLTA